MNTIQKKSLQISLVAFTLSVPLSVGCAWMPGDENGGPNGRPGVESFPNASDFSCEDEGDADLCMDFNDGLDGVAWEAGDWRNIDGRLVGYGPDSPPAPCSESLMSHAVVEDFTAENVRVRVELASVERVDKVLVLRSADEANRIQLNFRALTDDGDYGDLVVQEIRDCAFTIFTPEGELPIGHDLGEKIEADVTLTGTRLNVSVNGHQVVDREFPVAVRSGAIGFGIIDRATTLFDDLRVNVQ